MRPLDRVRENLHPLPETSHAIDNAARFKAEAAAEKLLIAEHHGSLGPEVEKVRQRLLDAARVRAEAVLSPFQMGQLKALLGKPYEGPPRVSRSVFD